MNNIDIHKLQELLYIWLSKYESKSLESIKISCNNLNNSYNMQLSKPIWTIFWPMVFNGIVEYIGDGRFALTESLIINCGTHCFSINCKPSSDFIETEFVGIYKSSQIPSIDYIKIIKTNTIPVLKQFPSIDKIVDSFPKTLQEESMLEYYNRKTEKGIAKLQKDGTNKYFSIPNKLYIREIPNTNINPDAFAIANCYGRVINDESNGIYNKDKRILYIPIFAFPLTIYRVLMLETMKTGILPCIKNNRYVFIGISNNVVNELNRIFCNSISYE